MLFLGTPSFCYPPTLASASQGFHGTLTLSSLIKILYPHPGHPQPHVLTLWLFLPGTFVQKTLLNPELE